MACSSDAHPHPPRRPDEGGATIPAADEGGATTISAIHSDVLQTHILTRLDGPTLASASCVSSQLYSLSTQDTLWRDICQATWPSMDNPRMRNLISTFPKGPRSFFSDSFPLQPSRPEPHPHHRSEQNPHPPSELIFAVDIYYRNKLIFSRLNETETLTSWFEYLPFRIDLLDPKEVVSTPIQYRDMEELGRHLAEDLTLSWIVIDPTGKKAANLSSWRPVSVHRHWYLSGEIQVKYASILAGDLKSSEFVQCVIMVTFGRCKEGEMKVKEVSLEVEDMDEMTLNGKASLVILQRTLDTRKRETYEEYVIVPVATGRLTQEPVQSGSVKGSHHEYKSNLCTNDRVRGDRERREEGYRSSTGEQRMEPQQRRRWPEQRRRWPEQRRRSTEPEVAGAEESL
ncbi:hypothetical protein HHK36_019371 [Tetracentron sinense]|uniref:F-box domain-containing protein n=1 Tax=Tetracentron sinense TaxID=13715 RepID=A0A834YX86_TETSI|nr:hypothetical protein HHK36_019371 [Tetracentron sinense]